MTARTEADGGWTFDTLLKHIESVIDANDKRYEQRFIDSQIAVSAALDAARTGLESALTSAKEAVTKAETAAEKRFEGVNEFRATLADQQRTLLPRVEADLRFSNNENRIAAIETALTELSARKTGGKELWAIIIAVLGAAALIYGLTK